MADGAETIRELLTGFNSLAMHVGMTPISFQNQGFQTPQTPALKTPGEFSQEMMQRVSQQSEATVRAVQQVRMTPGPGILGLNPASVSNTYAAQYQSRMQDIESRYLSPHQAQQFTRGGQPAFMNMPSPIFQTAPSMGIFRPNMTLPPPIPLAREAPIIPSPFAPTPPTPFFQTPGQMAYQQRALADERMFAGTMAAAPTAANLMAGGITTAAGWGLGGRIGQALGGARGAAIGRLGGLIGGAALGFGALGGLAEQGVETGIVNPIVQRRAFGRQLEQISQQFVVGGADLNPITGRGLATRPAVQLAGAMQQDVEGGQTAGFNMRDMMRITGMAAQGGMLDMAQNGEQVRQQMRNVARGLRSFMEIAQEPDVRRAMQQMSSMRTMGLTIPETNVAMRNAQTFARMAGTTVQNLQAQAGMPGAMTFQQMGMTAGLGMQVGQAAAGLTQQAIAGGAFTPGQLAMAGGQGGLTQTLTEAGAAGLGVNFPLLAMLRRGGGGQGALEIDPERARRIMRGDITLSQQAQMGAENIQRLGGANAISELSTRLNELRDELGRTLGPQGTTMYTMRQAVNVMKDIPGLTFGGALRQLGLSPQQARSMEIMGQSPQFWQNLRQQHDVNIRQMREEEATRRERIAEASSLTGRMGTWWRGRGMLDRPGEMVRSASQSISEWWTERNLAQDAAERGATYVPESRMMRVEDQRVQEQINRFVQTGGQRRWEQAQGRALRGQAAPITFGQAAGAGWNTALGVGAGIATLATGGLAGAALGIGGGLIEPYVTSGAAAESQYIQAMRAGGGLRGALAGALPSIAAMTAGTPEEQRQRIEEVRQAGTIGGAIRAGQGLSTRESLAVQRDLRSAAAETARATGTRLGKNVDLMSLAVTGALNIFRQKTGLTRWGHEAATPREMQRSMVESMVAGGVDRQFAEKYVKGQWDRGLKEIVMRKVEPLLTDATRGGYTASIEAERVESAIAGANLKEVQASAEALEETAMDKELAMHGGFLRVGASEEAQQNYKEMAMKHSARQMLYLQARSLGDTEEGRAIRKRLRDEMGATEFEALEERMRGVPRMSEEQRRAFRYAGEQSAARSSTEMLTQAEQQRAGFIGRRARIQGAVGAAQYAERMGAFQSIVQQGQAGVGATLESMDENQLRDLERENPELARIARQYKGTTDEGRRGQLSREFYSRVQGVGSRTTRRELGGRGMGGAAERREREQMGAEEGIWSMIKSRAKKAVLGGEPTEELADAAGELREVTKDLKDTVQAARLMLKMPNKG